MTSPNLRVSIRKGGVMEDFREDHNRKLTAYEGVGGGREDRMNITKP